MYRQYTPTLKSTIGNDLTGNVDLTFAASGGQGVLQGGSGPRQAGGLHSTQHRNSGCIRFSGSSGTYNLLYLNPRHIKGGNHSHSRGTIGNDLTGCGTFNQIAEHEVSDASGCLSFGRGSSHLGYRNSDNWYNGAVLRFSGSSGFTGSVLEWPALYSQPCHHRSLDHSRGTIGNDLTGRAALIDPEWIACSGVFSVERSGSWKYAGGGGYSAGAIRFSGSSGCATYCTPVQATTATAEAR